MVATLPTDRTLALVGTLATIETLFGELGGRRGMTSYVGNQRPRACWRPLAPDVYRITWSTGEAWLLTATPGARRPWLLTNGDVEQEIGSADLRTAQRQAAFWLDVRALTAPHDARTS
jgi:hypothetical protein